VLDLYHYPVLPILLRLYSSDLSAHVALYEKTGNVLDVHL